MIATVTPAFCKDVLEDFKFHYGNLTAMYNVYKEGWLKALNEVDKLKEVNIKILQKSQKQRCT